MASKAFASVAAGMVLAAAAAAAAAAASRSAVEYAVIESQVDRMVGREAVFVAEVAFAQVTAELDGSSAVAVVYRLVLRVVEEERHQDLKVGTAEGKMTSQIQAVELWRWSVIFELVDAGTVMYVGIAVEGAEIVYSPEAGSERGQNYERTRLHLA